MSKMPAIQFYPGDWRKDVGVQSLSFHDRGVWFEILMLMHESERRGLLVLNGRAMSEESLSRVLGLDKQSLTTTITTLIDQGIASRDEELGAVMCRRMVRDEALRRVRAECGKLGGNPALLGNTTRNKDKQNSTSGDKQNPTPSSSSSTSVKIATAGKFVLPEWIDSESWSGFEEMRRRQRKPMTDRARGMVVKELDKLRAAGNDVAACLNQSIRKSYLDVYPVAAGTSFERAGSSADSKRGFVDPSDAYSGKEYSTEAS